MASGFQPFYFTLPTPTIEALRQRSRDTHIPVSHLLFQGANTVLSGPAASYEIVFSGSVASGHLVVIR